jgi:hypothetical protein
VGAEPNAAVEGKEKAVAIPQDRLFALQHFIASSRLILFGFEKTQSRTVRGAAPLLPAVAQSGRSAR